MNHQRMVSPAARRRFAPPCFARGGSVDPLHCADNGYSVSRLGLFGSRLHNTFRFVQRWGLSNVWSARGCWSTKEHRNGVNVFYTKSSGPEPLELQPNFKWKFFEHEAVYYGRTF